MAVTSVKLNNLELASGNYGVSQSTLAALEGGVPRKPILAAIAGDHPEARQNSTSRAVLPDQRLLARRQQD